jgi:demethylmenaquinone methyltransferase/2-methoxy-6-polyprenyl-1,4-benzoquinol methylase
MTDPNPSNDRTADFGFEQVPWGEKARRVRGVFDSVAGKYDLMNDLMSGGLHRIWKQFTLGQTGLRPGQRALDVAGGTGDLSKGMAKQVGAAGQVVLTDINAAMLERGRERLLNEGFAGNIVYAQANAEKLPFADGSFDCVTIAFGLRNVTDKPAALASMKRVLRPGGQLLVLEFSHPTLPMIKPLYDAYSFRVLPFLGKLVATMRTATSIWRSPSANILIRRLCSG